MLAKSVRRAGSEMKRSNTLVKATQPLFNNFNDLIFRIFHNGQIDCRDVFMLFSVYNTVKD